MRQIALLVGVVVFLVTGTASGQEPQAGAYVCRDKRTELLIAPCYGTPLRCDLRVFEDGKEKPGGILQLPAIDQELTRCLGPGTPKVPTKPGAKEPVSQPATGSAPARGQGSQPPVGSTGAGRGSAAPADAGGLPPSTDPGTEAARRCVASGRSLVDCVGVAFGTALGGTPLAPGSVPAGLRVNGGYRGSSKTSMMFLPRSDAGVSVAWPCGIESDSYHYTVRVSQSQTVVAVDTQPQAITFTLAANGTLVGPPSVTVEGRVLVGHQPGVRTYSDGRTEPISRPIYEVKKVSCSIGTLAPTGEIAPAEPTATAPVAFGAQVLGLDSAAQQAAQTKQFKASPGVRLLGTYKDPTGSNVEFRVDSATVNCGDVSVAESYSVAPRGGQLVITLANQPAPIALSVGRDGALTGPGALDVAGRVMTGMNGSQVTFAPKTGRCTIAVLRP